MKWKEWAELWRKMGAKQLGTAFPFDVYCPRCDVFGHALASYYCGLLDDSEIE